MNSIKLTYEEYRAFRSEQHPLYSGYEGRPITKKIRRFGVDPEGIDLYIKHTGTGYILSNGPLESPKLIINPELTENQWEEIRQALLKDIEQSPFITIEPGPGSVEIIEPEVDKTEVMNIFNELLDEWYKSEEYVIENLGNHSDFIENDRNELRGKKVDYIKRFKEALGVE